MLDLSLSGTALLANRRLGYSGDLIVVRLRPSPESGAIELPCVIHRVSEGSPKGFEDLDWLHGTKFVTLDPVAWIFVNRYVDQHARRSGPPDTRWIGATGDLVLWGGLYLALSNGFFHPLEREKLTWMTSGAMSGKMADIEPTIEGCLERFSTSLKRLPKRLRAAETYRVLDSLLQVAAADGEIDDHELKAFEVLAGQLGLNKVGSDMVVGNYLSGV